MDEFLKRLWITAAFLLFSFNMIHVLMWTSGGYSRSWLFVLTGKLVWFELLVFKIAIGLGIIFGGWRFVENIKSSLSKSEGNRKEELRIAEYNKKVVEQKALYEGYEEAAQAWSGPLELILVL